MRGSDLLTFEALRLYERYQTELIERYSICPWAKNARLDGRTRAHVVTDSACDLASVVPLLAQWSTEPAVDVAFVIAPRFEAGLEAFSEWSSAIGRATHGAFVAAPFHPHASETHGVVHFLRQTPDPTVQLVRRATLERIRSQDPPHYTDIFELDLRALEADKPTRTVAASVLAHNAQLLEREGRATLQQIIDDIRQDRERTYARLIPR
ncbi:MAG: hypothetical protein AMJ62_15185 [Myxococcales bacterium SG8_38]|nr:MAG: hypothetical protein AMJ62_15185 [Myxococcales bacterium SG8_38]